MSAGQAEAGPRGQPPLGADRLKIFMSHSHAQRDDADRLALALRGDGHELFLDRDGLEPGDEYHASLRKALQSSELVLFMLTHESLRENSFARTEVEWAREQWPNPVGHVMALKWQKDLPDAEIPNYLATTTLREPIGNKVAATVGWVADFAVKLREGQRRVEEEQAREQALEAQRVQAQAELARRQAMRPRVIQAALLLGALLVGGAVLLATRSKPPPCLLRLTVLETPEPVSTADLPTLAQRRSYVVSDGVALLDFVGLTAAPATWTIQLVLQDGRLGGRFQVRGCPSKPEELSDDNGSRIRVEPRR